MAGVLVGDGEDVVQQGAVQRFRHEIGADAHDAVRPGVALRKQRRGGRLHGDKADGRVLTLQIARYAGDGAARAHAGHHGGQPAAQVAPQFRAGGALVGGGVGGVVELPGQHRAGGGGNDLIRSLHRAGHALVAGGEYQLRAVGGKQHAPLEAHRLRHGQHEAVAPRRAQRRQRHARVARGRLHHGAALLEQAARFQIVEHGLGGAVLGAARGVEVFQLGVDLRAGKQAVQFQQRRIADERLRALHDRHGKNPPLRASIIAENRRLVKRGGGCGARGGKTGDQGLQTLS